MRISSLDTYERNSQKSTLFESDKQHDEGFRGTIVNIVNRALFCFHGGSLKITILVPLNLEYFRQHAKHMWSEISEHQNTGKLLEKYLEPGELRAVNKVLDGLH